MAKASWSKRLIDEATLACRQREPGTVRFSDGGVEFSALIPDPGCRLVPSS